MPFNSKDSKRDDVVNIERLPVFGGRLATVLAHLIALSNLALRRSPGRAVIRLVSAFPVEVVFSANSGRIVNTLTQTRTKTAAGKVTRFSQKMIPANLASLRNYWASVRWSTKFLASVESTDNAAIFFRQPLSIATKRTKATARLLRSGLKHSAAVFAKSLKPRRGIAIYVRDVRLTRADIRTVFAGPTGKIRKALTTLWARARGPLFRVSLTPFLAKAFGRAIHPLSTSQRSEGLTAFPAVFGLVSLRISLSL